MDDLIAKALHAARQHFGGGGDAANIPPEFTSDSAGEPVDFRPLNFEALRNANAVRVTHRANPDGTTDPDPGAGFSIVSGWNDSMAGRNDPRSTVTWPNNPEAYGVVSDMFANNPEWITPHKYRQIVHSARELGMRDEDVYTQPRADGGHVDAALHMLRHHLAGGGLLSGPDYLSTGEEVSPTNWGNPDVASDFFKADKALRLAREIQAKADTDARRPPIPDRVVEEAPALPRAALRVAAEPSPQMAAMLARAETDPGKIEGRAAPEADKIAARAPQGPELTDRDRDLIIRTIAAETSGKTPEESQAIAHVILNRIQSGKYGASPEAVLRAKSQFEPWSNPALANYPMKFLPNSRRYGMGQAALEAALSGDDITGGALNFWGPMAQYALGREAPGWAADMPDYSDIGETRFHRPRAEGGEVDAALRMVREHHADGEAVGQAPEVQATPTPEDAAVTIARRQPVTPASMARAWTTPEEAISEGLSPRARDYMETYPEKFSNSFSSAVAGAPEAVVHAVTDPFVLARQAYEGQLPPDYFHSDEGIGRAFNAAALPMTGSFGLSGAVGPTLQEGEAMLGMAVKPKGGNWIKGSVEAETEGLKNRDLARALQEPADLPAANMIVNDPINNWIDKKLNKYIKNEMGTPEDPIRPLAERDILHIKPELMFPTYKDRPGQTRLAQSNTARAWEDVSDRSIVGGPAKNYFDYDQGIPWAGAQEVYEKNPWLEKVLPETTVYEANASRQITNDLGFDHLIDELKNSVRPDSDLPTHLRMTPDKLDKVSMPQAVELVSRINKWREEAAANALAVNANNEATHLVKEYPDKGYKWVELKPPTTVSEEVLQSLNPFEKNLYQRYLEAGDTPYNALQGVIGDQAKVSPALKAALKYEGDMMGHCVGGYCDNVAAGESRIFSLRDSKGRPHVTIETEPSRHLDGFGNAINKIEPGLWEKMGNEGGRINPYKWLQENRPYIYNKMKAENIVQVKGKGNWAPKNEYLPFVQDFIKSKDWNVIGDLHNTGLYEVKPGQRLPGFSREIDPGLYSMEDFQKMAVKNEMPQEIMDQWMTKLRNPRDYASGGSVNDASCGCEKSTDGGLVDRALEISRKG